MNERVKEFYDEVIGNEVYILASYYAEHMGSNFDQYTPIEQLMSLALFHEFRQFRRYWDISYGINRQSKIGNFIVDFLIVVECKSKTEKIVIECDGHDYHEKTKEQASNDKGRDRELQKNDYAILRFSGSDIWKNPTKCAEEVIEFIIKKIDK